MLVKMTGQNRVLFPKSKITKKEYLDYYRKIAGKMLLEIKDRPISMQRFPNGIKGEIFFQKNVARNFPKSIKRVLVKREGRERIKMAYVDSANGLLYLVNQVCIMHPWLSKKDKLNYPDRIIFDIDPSVNDFKKVKEAALELKKLLSNLKLPAYLMTTGSKGVHVIVPIKRTVTFAKAREIAKAIAGRLVEKDPKKYTLQIRKKKRRGRIFVDYLRNSFAQTAVAPYSVRAIEKAPVAMPIGWEELSQIVSSQAFNIKNAIERKKNPWKGMGRKAVDIKKLSRFCKK